MDTITTTPSSSEDRRYCDLQLHRVRRPERASATASACVSSEQLTVSSGLRQRSVKRAEPKLRK
eukprot:1731406-Pleurochrysis_carterae.AAC.1